MEYVDAQWEQARIESRIAELIAAVPKVGVAYVGTFVVGRLAHSYYATGRRPPKEAVARFQAQALAQLQAVFGRPASRQRPPGELPAGPPDQPDRPAR